MRPARGQLIGVGRSRRRSLGRWAQCIHSTLYTGPLLIRGKSDCWPLQLLELELDYQHCPHAPSVSWHKCSELTAVQCSAVQTPDTPRWSQPRVNHCVHLRSLKYSWWLTEMQTAVDRHGLVNCRALIPIEADRSSASIAATWQKCSLHRSYLTELQLP